jgi:hypothetical protein
MNIIKATLIKQKTEDGKLEVTQPIGTTYLVDLDTIGSDNPRLNGLALRVGERLTVLTVCDECRGHYVGQYPVELLKLEAQA